MEKEKTEINKLHDYIRYLYQGSFYPDLFFKSKKELRADSAKIYAIPPLEIVKDLQRIDLEDLSFLYNHSEIIKYGRGNLGGEGDKKNPNINNVFIPVLPLPVSENGSSLSSKLEIPEIVQVPLRQHLYDPVITKDQLNNNHLESYFDFIKSKTPNLMDYNYSQ